MQHMTCAQHQDCWKCKDEIALRSRCGVQGVEFRVEELGFGGAPPKDPKLGYKAPNSGYTFLNYSSSYRKRGGPHCRVLSPLAGHLAGKRAVLREHRGGVSGEGEADFEAALEVTQASHGLGFRVYRV